MLDSAHTVRRNQMGICFGPTVKAVGAAFLVLLVLVLGAFSASPELHHQLHPDSTQPDHFCLITAFANGQLEAAAALPIVAVACVFLLCGTQVPVTPLVSVFRFRYSPSRAPPRF